jgi:spore coat protein U-like protein
MPAFERRGVLIMACGLAAALAMAIPQPSFAGSATAPLGVSLTITAGCTVLAPPIRAGAAAKPSNPGVEINCTSAVPYSVTRYSVLDIAPDAKGITLTVIY